MGQVASPRQLDAFDSAIGDLHTAIADTAKPAPRGSALQLRASGGGARGPDPHAIAAGGLRGTSTSLPHQARIQAAFGRHDVSHVAAHVGGPAREASAALGARAFATGDAIAFAQHPDLHTAAHEAAHFIQQRAGVSLAGGLGQVGDAYERHADQVADRVVRGESVEGLLDGSPSAASPGGRAIQRAAAGAPSACTASEAACTDDGSARFAAIVDPKAVVRKPGTLQPTAEIIPMGTGVEIVETRVKNGTKYVRVQASQGGQEWWTAASNLHQATRPAGPGGVDAAALEDLSLAVIAAAPPEMRQAAASSVRAILRQAAELRVRDPRQVAYMLATAQHESNLGSTTVEKGNRIKQDPATGDFQADNHVTKTKSKGATRDAADQNYWDDAYGGKNGNVKGTADGQKFRGRGYAQVTFKNNYQRMSAVLNAQGFSYVKDGKQYGGAQPQASGGACLGWEPRIDLVAHPEHVNSVPALAARLLVEGSAAGHYTKHKVGDHLDTEQGKDDYSGARGVINGDQKHKPDNPPQDMSSTQGQRIGQYARTFEEVLGYGDAWSLVFSAP